MRDITAWFAVVGEALPLPPGVPSEDPDVNGLVVIAAVVVILGGVVFIAWLLKPLVVRRLAAEEAASSAAEPGGEEPSAGWDDAWSQTRRGTVTVARPSTVTPETEPSTQDIVAEEEIETVPEAERDEAPPPDGDVTASSAVESAEPPEPEQPLSPAIAGHEYDTEAIVGITLTVRELLDHANNGQVLRGFALYSESFLARFQSETGLSDEEFTATFEAIPPPPPDARAELAAVSEVELLPDGRVRAAITYTDGAAAPTPERFTFVRATTGDRWLIDDIAGIEEAG